MSQSAVVITGGTRGIGRSIAEAFAAAGYHVVASGRRPPQPPLGDGIEFVAADAREEQDHQRLVESATRAGRELTCYINNAGFSEWRPIAAIDAAFLDDMLGTNLRGVFWGCKAAAEALRDDGSIINVSSIAGKRGSANNSAYCASKFAVNGVTQSLAKELGPRGVRVNAVCPVLVTTRGLLDALQSPYAPGQGDPQRFLAAFTSANAALERLPTGREVGEMCCFLASPAASAITGQCINVDCGVFPQ